MNRFSEKLLSSTVQRSGLNWNKVLFLVVVVVDEFKQEWLQLSWRTNHEPCNVPGDSERLWWPVVELLCLSSRARSSVSRTPLWIITVQFRDLAPFSLLHNPPYSKWCHH